MREMNYHVGKGYKLVRIGELIHKGDEYWDWCEWRPTQSWEWGHKREKYWKVVRRKV